MKALKLSLMVWLAALLLSSWPANGAQRSSLEGAWNVGGGSDANARITNNRGQLEATNEHGHTSRLESASPGRVRALDWGGITGEVRGDRINWSNNTYWTRASNSAAYIGNMEGTWYVRGSRDANARITNNRGQLEATNENGQTSRLEFAGRGRVRAMDWDITGEVRGDRINWSNNTYWSRAQNSAAYTGNMEGAWYVGGARDAMARITNNRGQLEATNENGQTSRLESAGRGRVRAMDWDRITGEVRYDRIEWSNNTYWSRGPNR
jgi:hypothetical protein